MKTMLITLLVLTVTGLTFGMTGGPLFCVGTQTTSMTVEASKSNLKLESTDGSSSKATAVSDRLQLVARYGLMPGVDVAGSLGAGNLRFSKLSAGYSDFTANWSLAWGGALRAGFPVEARPFQVVAVVNYFGFQPNGKTSNAFKSVSSKYLWHEVTPTLAAGCKFGPVVPYLGVAKPFLFGRKEVSVSLRGEEFPAAGSNSSYSDSEQALRGLLGIEWKLPEGYSIGAEAMTTSDGTWTLGISLAQVLR